MAVNIDLEQSVVLAVVVSVQVCPVCGRMSRAQPPFLRPRAVYTQRVVQKAIEAVYHDGMALHQHVASARAIGRQLGVNHGAVRQWLKLTPPDAATVAELSSTTGVLPIVEPPPAP